MSDGSEIREGKKLVTLYFIVVCVLTNLYICKSKLNHNTAFQMSKKSTKYSPTMLAYMDKHSIQHEAVCYLTIQRVHLDRIVKGEKTVEFRDLSDFYIKKFFVVSGDEVTGIKPYTHILFQAGYSADSPRTLVEFKGAGTKVEEQKSPVTEKGKRIYAEAEAEGFTLDDEWIGIELGRVCVSEGM